jgi:alanine racemase
VPDADFASSPHPESTPRAWAEWDLDALAANFAYAAARAPEGRVLFVLKADGYGHGATILARAAERLGAAMIGVGDSGEGLELRRAGVRGRILILGALAPSEIGDVVAADITPVVHSEGRLAALEDEAQRRGKCVGIHLKVDTGMGRLGALPSRALELAERISTSRGLRLLGVMSHLAGSAGDPANQEQAQALSGFLGELERRGIRPGEVHLRNSAGLLDPALRVPGETMARAGALLLGFSGSGGARPHALRPVLSLRTQIVFMKDVPKGSAVGYGGTWVAERATRLGVLSIGYADGVRSRANGKGVALIRGRRCAFLGRVSMDYTTVDLSEVPGARVGDTATLIGRSGDEELSVEEVAERAESVPYEVLCGLGRRVVRRPSSGSAAPAW